MKLVQSSKLSTLGKSMHVSFKLPHQYGNNDLKPYHKLLTLQSFNLNAKSHLYWGPINIASMSKVEMPMNMYG
jgi:hypothetical protein